MLITNHISITCLYFTLLVNLAIAQATPETANVSDPMGAYFVNHVVIANRSIYEMRIDLTADGNDEVLISDDEFHLISQGPRGWAIFRYGDNHLYTGLTSGLGWDIGQQGVIVQNVSGHDSPTIIIPLQGTWEGKPATRYQIVSVDVEPDKFGLSYYGWLRTLLPGKSDAEYDAIYSDAKIRGVDMSTLKVTKHNLNDLARRYRVVTYDNIKDYQDFGDGKNIDPGFRLLAPGLPENGIPFVLQKGKRLEEVKAQLIKEYIATQQAAMPTSDSASTATATTSSSVSLAPTMMTPAPAANSAAAESSDDSQKLPWIFILLAAGAGLLVAVVILRRRST